MVQNYFSIEKKSKLSRINDFFFGDDIKCKDGVLGSMNYGRANDN